MTPALKRHRETIGAELHGEQPRDRGQSELAVRAGAQRELPRIGLVDVNERVAIEDVALRRPADRAHVPLGDGLAQRLGDPHHHQ